MSISRPANVAETAQANQAHEMLLERLGRIPGVRVSEYESRPLGQPVFQITLEPDDMEAEKAVYRAELEVYQRFPEARIELYVV